MYALHIPRPIQTPSRLRMEMEIKERQVGLRYRDWWIEVPVESGDKDNLIEVYAEPKSSEEETGIDETDFEWTPSRANRG